jgi:glutathione S-transferase
MPKPTLVGLSYSPWTQRARWALDHHDIGYTYEEYLPVVGEAALRLRARKLGGKTSVPVLLTPHGAIFDSIAIAKHADSIGKGSKLYDGHEAAVARWLEVAEPALNAARALVIRAVERNPRAQEESVSLPMPRALKRPTAKFGSAVLRWKWNARHSEGEAQRVLASALEQLRAALAGKEYLDGQFSLADIIMAGVVQGVQPVSDQYIPLQPGTRETWTQSELAAQFPDLIKWRDALFAKHFQRRST